MALEENVGSKELPVKDIALKFPFETKGAYKEKHRNVVSEPKNLYN